MWVVLGLLGQGPPLGFGLHCLLLLPLLETNCSACVCTADIAVKKQQIEQQKRRKKDLAMEFETEIKKLDTELKTLRALQRERDEWPWFMRYPTHLHKRISTSMREINTLTVEINSLQQHAVAEEMKGTSMSLGLDHLEAMNKNVEDERKEVESNSAATTTTTCTLVPAGVPALSAPDLFRPSG